ncbi:lysis protein [Pseudomonas sp. gcc21]|uniref:lysis protein n=1 Tax=Pseudomonas sp. gcc21 TaxID=2726989 RepID=UPI0014510EAF|nr:lysis protein [Pseudomonas sp. gcc21]QJD58187.1 lysis protein [Pseudomonas sp. gcc21]
MNRILLSLCGLLLLAALLLGWRLDRHSATIAKVTDQLSRAEAKANSLTNTLRLQRELITDAAALDARHTRELHDAQRENDELRAAVVAGTVGLRVNASCPRVSDTPSTTSLDDGAAPELTADAREAYHTLRAQLTADRAKLTGLQDYIRETCR